MNDVAICVEIDALTQCLIHRLSGEIVQTEFRSHSEKISKRTAKNWLAEGWLFDWSIPQKEGFEIYDLFAVNDSRVQGKIALKHECQNLFTHVKLVESAPINRGADKEYIGVGGQLFAFACKLSFEVGNAGFVQFVAKTDLIEYYTKNIYALSIDGQKMYIDTCGAAKLVAQYYPEESSHA